MNFNTDQVWNFLFCWFVPIAAMLGFTGIGIAIFRNMFRGD